MFLLIYFLTILFLIGPSTPAEGIELGNNQQTELEVNLVDQCMARAEVGPQGQYQSSMRFKFLLNASRECNGSILLCYPGQLDPDKTIGLSAPTAHWAIRNLANNPIAERCNEIRWNECYKSEKGCEMDDTPWHGIYIRFGYDGQIEFNMSTGGSYKFPLTNFTLMLHNNAVNDEADPTAFLVNDYDNQNLCIKQDAFPIGGQSKPVVSKILLHGNDANYKKWKKMENVGQDGKLKDYPHLFRLSWDMLPKTQLDEDDEKLNIWMERNVSKPECTTSVFFFDRMQSEANIFDICPNTAEVTKIPLSAECPKSGWKLIKAAKLTDEYGSELIVRVGFLNTNIFKRNDVVAGEEWIPYRRNLSTSPMIAKNMPKSLKPFIKTFHYGDFRYASVQNDFGFNVHMDRQLEALVLDCPLGIISTLVRPVQGGFDPSKIPKAEQPIYDWSEDFDQANQCNQSQHLLVRRTVKIENAWGQIRLGVADGLLTGLSENQIKQEKKNGINVTTIDTIAHRYKFHGRINNNDMSNKYAQIEKFGRILSFDEDEYTFQKFKSIFTILNISKEMVESYKSRRAKTSEILIKKSCASKHYCKESLARDFCEDQNAVYECDADCSENNCNGDSIRTCINTSTYFHLHYKSSLGGFQQQLVKYLNESGNEKRCSKWDKACYTEICRNENVTLLTYDCAPLSHCMSVESENVPQHVCEKDYQCHVCEKDKCNNKAPEGIPVRKCFSLDQSYNEFVQTEPAGYNTSKNCLPHQTQCRTETCFADEKMWIGKGCAEADYCTSGANWKNKYDCEVESKGHYECRVCHGLDNCNGLPRQRCYNSSGGPFEKNEGFFSVHDISTPIGVKDTECPESDMNYCATEQCQKPSEFMVLGLYVLEYQCPKISFFLPRFDGAILDGTEPKYRKNPIRRKGNLVQKFEIDHQYWDGEIEKIEVDPNNLTNYFYDLYEKKWVNNEIKT